MVKLIRVNADVQPTPRTMNLMPVSRLRPIRRTLSNCAETHLLIADTRTTRPRNPSRDHSRTFSHKF